MNRSEFTIWTGSILFAAFVHGLLFMQWNANWGVNQSKIQSHSLTTRLNFKITEPYMPEQKPVVQKKKLNKRTTEEKAAEVKAIEMPTEVEHQPQRERPPSNSTLLAQQREHYLGQLMAHIEKFKFYPRAARRRGIQGDATVSFKLGQMGEVTELIISSDYGILKQAATEAIKSALPLPLPPQGASFSRQFKFNMRYTLK